MAKDTLKELEETLIQVGLKIARRGEGALFVVGKVNYKPLVEQTVHSFNVCDNPKLLESLALMDGAVIINKNRKLVAFGAMIRSTTTLKNFGTRHSAALTASKKKNLVIMVSEEDKKVRIFKNGRMVMQLDPSKKDIEKSVPIAVNVLESVGAGTIGALGTSLLAPTLGVALLPGIVIFGSAYYLGRSLKRRFIK